MRYLRIILPASAALICQTVFASLSIDTNLTYTGVPTNQNTDTKDIIVSVISSEEMLPGESRFTRSENFQGTVHYGDYIDDVFVSTGSGSGTYSLESKWSKSQSTIHSRHELTSFGNGHGGNLDSPTYVSQGFVIVFNESFSATYSFNSHDLIFGFGFNPFSEFTITESTGDEELLTMDSFFTGTAGEVSMLAFDVDGINYLFEVTSSEGFRIDVTVPDGFSELVTLDFVNGFQLPEFASGPRTSTIEQQFVIVPEPSTYTLIAGILGLCFVVASRHRK